MHAGYLTEEMKAAHQRMVTSLPSRKNQYVEESDKTTAAQVIVNGRRYPSITKAARAEGMALTTLYDLESRGLVRFIRQGPLAGMPIFKSSTTSKDLTRRLRSYERKEAAK